MKKRGLLALALSAACLVGGVACGAHEHEYTLVPVDDATHKSVCECGDESVSAHVWDAGVVQTPATVTEEGVMLFTCEECGGTKTESIARINPQVTDDEWVEAMNFGGKNFTEVQAMEDHGHTSTSIKKTDGILFYQGTDHYSMPGVILQEIYFYKKGEQYFSLQRMRVTMDSWEATESEITEESYQNVFEKSNYNDTFPKANYAFDEEKGCYVLTGSYKDGDGYTMTESSIVFENGKVVRIDCTRASNLGEEHESVYKYSMSFTYGDVVIEIPEV